MERVPFTTFAEFKRLAQVGSLLQKEWHGEGIEIEPTTKVINHVQSNAIAFAIDGNPKDGSSQNRSWFYFPKSETYLIRNNALILLDTGKRPYFSYSFVHPQNENRQSLPILCGVPPEEGEIWKETFHKGEIMSQKKYAPLTCYRIHYDNHTSSVINMAAGITLQEATDYFLGKTFIDEAPETGKETRHTCIKVEAYQGV